MFSFRKLRFGVTEGQISVDYIDIVARRHAFVLAEISTPKQKYPEIKGHSGANLQIGASESTFPESFDPNATLTLIHTPLPLRGWDVLPEGLGRHSLRVAFYKPGIRNPCQIVKVPPGVIWDGKAS